MARSVFTVYSLQLIVPEVERDQFGPAAQAENRRPLQAVVGQIQMLQVTQGLRDGDKQTKRSRVSGGGTIILTEKQ